MKKHFLLLICCITGIVHGQSWQQLADFPGTERDDGTVFVIGSKVYCGLGMNAWFDCSNDFQVFDLGTESWSLGPELPVAAARQYANGFAHHGSGYIFGGIDAAGNFLNDLWKLDPATGAWTLLSSMPAAGRSGAVCFVIADTAYIVGGRNAAANALNEVWAYHLSDGSWTQRATLPFDGTWRGVAFSWQGKGLVGLGKDNLNNLHDAWYSYTPGTDTWEIVPGLTTGGTTYTAFTQVENQAFLYGGMNASGTLLNTFLRLDLETFQFHVLPDFPATARKGGLAFAGNSTFYLTTGVSTTARSKETWKSMDVLAIPENTSENRVTLFPNPAHGAFNVQATTAIRQITLRDLCGKTLLQKQVNGKSTTVGEISFPAGIYILEVAGDGFAVVEKLVLD